MKSSLFARRAHSRPSSPVRRLIASTTLLLAIVLLAGSSFPTFASGDWTTPTPFWLTGDAFRIFDDAIAGGSETVRVVSTSGSPDSTVSVADGVTGTGGETARRAKGQLGD